LCCGHLRDSVEPRALWVPVVRVRIRRNTNIGLGRYVRSAGPLNPNRRVGGAPIPIGSLLAAGHQSHFYLHIGTENSQSVTPFYEVLRGTTKTLYPLNPRGFQPGAVFLLGVARCGSECIRMTTWTAVEAVPRIVSLQQPDWSLSMKDLEQAITKQTKAIVVNTPGNPSGKVFSTQELEGIAEAARRHDLFVFTDEIYEYFVYDDRTHVSLASFPNMIDRTVTISGYSKTFSITGWRIGHALAAPQWSTAIGAMNDLIYVCAPAPLQYGVAVGIQELRNDFYQDLQQSFQAKRDRFCQVLDNIGLSPTIPQGAYYVLADVSHMPGETGKERAMYVLNKTGVAGVPGEAFFQGDPGASYIRFSFAKTDADLDAACERLQSLR